MGWGSTYSQLAPFQDDDAMVTPNFKDDIIRDKKLSKISVHYFTKPDGGPINDDGVIKCYYFDTTGKIVQSVYIVKAGEKVCDSMCCKYYYDNSGNICIKRNCHGDFFDTWYYKWGDNHLLLTEAHVHETNVISPEGNFKPATQKVISSDSFAYINYPKQLQQYCFNEDNKVFQKTIIQYDENKRFLSRNSHYAVGWLYSQVELNYDTKGNIISYNNTGNVNGDINQSTIIKYDSLGKMAEQGIFENGKQIHHIEFMYDNDGLISNQLDRCEEKATISILRYEYEVYPNRGLSTATK